MLRGSDEDAVLLVKARPLERVSGDTGGVVWIVLFTGHTFTHGSIQSPRGATILGFGSLHFYRLLALPPLLFIWGLVGARATRDGPGGRLGRVGFVAALVGLAMVAFGVVLETWIVDSDKDFYNPLVQGGWILFLFGLFPVLPVGMILFAVGSSDIQRRLRMLAVVIGLWPPFSFWRVCCRRLPRGVSCGTWCMRP